MTTGTRDSHIDPSAIKDRAPHHVEQRREASLERVTRGDVDRAAVLIHSALDDTLYMDHTRMTDEVGETTARELAAALLKAGWTPPSTSC